MKLEKLILLILLAMIVGSGCSWKETIVLTSTESEDPEFRRIKDLCEQEAQGRCWKPVDSAPLYLREYLEKRKQQECKTEWILTCLEKHGYQVQQ